MLRVQRGLERRQVSEGSTGRDSEADTKTGRQWLHSDTNTVVEMWRVI